MCLHVFLAAILAILVILVFIIRLLWKRRNKAHCISRLESQTRRVDALEKALPSEHSSFTASTRPSEDARSQRTFVRRSSVSTRHLHSTPTSRTVFIDDQSATHVHTKRLTSLELSYRDLLATSSISKKPKPWNEDGLGAQTPIHGRLGSIFSQASIRPSHQPKHRFQATKSTDIELDVISKSISPTRSPISPSLTTTLGQLHSPVPKLTVSLPSPLIPGSFISYEGLASSSG
jgi:hypothetical protein